jgi:hypothetical protein
VVPTISLRHEWSYTTQDKDSVHQRACNKTDQLVEASFCVMYREKGQSYYFRLLLERTYADCLLSRMQYLHEIFLANTRVKNFFDLDMPGVSMTEDEKTAFLLRFYNFLVRSRAFTLHWKSFWFGKSSHQSWRCQDIVSNVKTMLSLLLWQTLQNV